MKFRKSQQKYNKSTMQTELARNLVHNFSSFAISQEQLNALSYGLDHHIPTKANGHAVSADLAHIKNKLRNSCEKDYNVKVSKHQSNVTNNLMKRNDTVIMKQDKGRGVVIMDKSKYT